MGDITRQAKIVAYQQGISQELIETFTLFGDPAMRLKLEPLVIYKVYLPLIATR